ncbi:hypothetical protein ODJ79_18680 [Actinoplanes sp. KI2]|uniref:hypothetical protein n=1 Tax=Actinoplanes sp. KI2 TaxID=2983315 RepID=UPI0021D59419|nr:hypothetical protein [Actinoplanes sp. KI2]MCU7725760.1 hypothetical protein [Actinoplanes sp. KI2]
MTRFFSAVGRNRRVILAVGLALAVGYVTANLWLPDLAQRAFPTLITLVLCLLVLATVAAMIPRPWVFQVRPQVPAFSAPASPVTVLATLALLVLAAGNTGVVLRDLGTTDTVIDWLRALFSILVTVPPYVGIWRGLGIELRPDGLRDREWAGTMIMPWEALPVVPIPGHPNEHATLRVRCARPELVRRRGLVTSRRQLFTNSIDQELAALAIRYYTTHPEHRSAIGTRSEYDRLLSEISEPPSAPDQDL